ncbi:histidine triad nucleotide-binding protein 3-like isoform X1 [Amphibalanus amphitrite]|uniref:histidine triad nucleotide-binding protein 3-like isoform X1 n=1 Tax=Amphibalanus amphitrite TaxID=1232801 RepID=UPI001C919FF5|nr:histidine triad nucleotide-binding protein 3-like isoform X1 [Amphibalanus amphitrite]
MRFPFGSNRLRDCVFCRIVEGREPNEILYKDQKYTAFSDIRPASKNHLLIITNEHVQDVTQLQGKTEVVDGLVNVANQLLEKNGADLNDVRLGFHWPPFHLVSHLHLHAIEPASQMSLLSRMVFRHGLWFASPEVAKQWLRDREARDAAARSPDDRERRRSAGRKSSSAANAAGQAEEHIIQDVEDQDVAEVTKKMAKMNK